MTKTTNTVDELMEEQFITKAKEIQPGKKYTLYIIYCVACNKYRRLRASPPLGPGGTLSCPRCRERKENGPGIEGSYGRVKVKSIEIILPEFRLE